MPKSRSKLKKTLLTSTATILEVTDEHDFSTGCTNRNCPSHWHNRLSEKVKTRQQTKLQTSSPIETKPTYQLSHSEILSKLFEISQVDETNQEIYSKPISKSSILRKHTLFANQISKRLANQTFIFLRTHLEHQLNYRRIPLVYLELSERVKTSDQLKINLLRVNHFHRNAYLSLKTISTPIYTRSTVHIIVQDENNHCLRLSMYNWSYFYPTRQIKSSHYLESRIQTLLPPQTSLLLFNPWLKQCEDGEISLRCESPNSDLIFVAFDQFDIEQLRQFGNACYQSDDNLSAIEYYSFGLRQLDKLQEKELNLKGQSLGPKTEEYEQHRIRLISNRCACYVRERHPILALSDTGIVLSSKEFPHIFEIPKSTTGKLLFRYLTAHLQLGLYDKVDNLLHSHRLSGEHTASMSILNKEMIRLKDESLEGKYNLQEIFQDNENVMSFVDLSHHHHEQQRLDLFEIRQCQQTKYPKNSFGVFALKDIEQGTLLIVEQSFASVDKRIQNEEYTSSINLLKRNSKVEFYSNDSLRLLNEIEKQLEIGKTSAITFEKLQLMQPIRQWLEENGVLQENSEELVDDYDEMLSEKYRWREGFAKRTSPYIPWQVLFQTDQQNPFRSRTHRGWYSLSSMFNHSCLPNCLWYLIGDYVFIYVIASNVKQDDELTISYCPLWISSLNERAHLLRRYEIDSCQCPICHYDRSRGAEYENELKKFRNHRALARQKNLTDETRSRYSQQLESQWDNLQRKFADRPVGFIHEFLDVEKISMNEDVTFLQRLSTICEIHLPEISNPLLLFGSQMNFLIAYLEENPIDQWKQFLEYLYRIYTFNSLSSSSSDEILKDQKQLFIHLFQTQSCLIEEQQL